jgi:type IV secretion system protein VirB4
MSMNGLKTISITDSLPKYGYPISDSIISLDDGRLMATLCIKGMPFESESESELEQAFNTVRGFFNQLTKQNGGKLAVWTHVVKQKDTLDVAYQFDSEFMQQFSAKYLESFRGQRFFTTNYYLTLVYKYDSFASGKDTLDELVKSTTSALSRFDCDVLKVSNDGKTAKNIEFLSFLLNGSNNQIPITSSKVAHVIGQSDWHFGYDLLEIRNHQSNTSKYATFYEIDGYPTTTSRGMWDFILKQQSEFILTQSMILMKGSSSLNCFGW